MAIRALGIVRAGQLALWAWVPFVAGHRLSPVVLVGYGVAAAWSALLFRHSLGDNGLGRGWLLADVAVTVTYTIVVNRAFPVGDAQIPWRSWVLGPLCGTAMVCAVYASTRWAVVLVGPHA